MGRPIKYHTEEERKNAKLESARKSYRANSAERIAANAEWRKANPEKVRASARKSFAKLNEEPFRLAEALYRAVLSSLNRAKGKRVLECNIDVAYIQLILNKQGYRLDSNGTYSLGYDAYYGYRLPLALRGNGKDPYSASVDRKDPSKGYVKGNIHIVCMCTNQQKMERTHKQMLKIVAKITGVA